MDGCYWSAGAGGRGGCRCVGRGRRGRRGYCDCSHRGRDRVLHFVITRMMCDYSVMATTASRGRPAIVDKVQLSVGDDKVTVTLVEGGRVQVSLPGNWAVTGMSGAAGRQRVDVQPLGAAANGSSGGTAKKAAVKKATPRKKAVAAATPTSIDVSDGAAGAADAKPVKRTRRTKRKATVLSGA